MPNPSSLVGAASSLAKSSGSGASLGKVASSILPGSKTGVFNPGGIGQALSTAGKAPSSPLDFSQFSPLSGFEGASQGKQIGDLFMQGYNAGQSSAAPPLDMSQVATMSGFEGAKEGKAIGDQFMSGYNAGQQSAGTGTWNTPDYQAQGFDPSGL